MCINGGISIAIFDYHFWLPQGITYSAYTLWQFNIAIENGHL